MKEERVATYFPNNSSCGEGSASKRKQQAAVAPSSSGSRSSSGLGRTSTPRHESPPARSEAVENPSGGGGGGEETFVGGEEVLEDAGLVANSSPSTFQSRLWKVLYGNINHSVDEFYHLCEEETNEDKCHEIIELLNRTSRDFVKLVERLEEQRNFDKDPGTGGISWEIRKPTRISTRLTNASQQTSPKLRNTKSVDAATMATAMASQDALIDKPRVTKLRAAAAPFQPSNVNKGGTLGQVATAAAPVPVPAAEVTKTESEAVAVPVPAALCADQSIDTKPQLPLAVTVNMTAKKSVLNLRIDTADLAPTRISPGQSPVSINSLSSSNNNERRKSHLSSCNSPANSKKPREKERIKVQSNSICAPVLPPSASPARADEWDEDTEAQVVLASEQVWAEAEAWVEAEAAAEEAAWLKLREVGNKENRSKHVNQSRPQENASAAPLSPAGDWRIPTVLSSPGESSQRQLKKEKPISRRLLSSPADANLRPLTPVVSDRSSSIRASAISVSLIDTAAEEEECKETDNDIKSPRRILLSSELRRAEEEEEEEEEELLLDNFNFNRDFRVGSGSKTTASSPMGTSGHSTPMSGSTSGRSLHAKLSSPDRRRALSPTEAKRKHEARQIAAESNRDRSVNERVQKAMIASVRVKLRSEKEAQRLAQAEQALEDKLKNAEQRHDEHIKSIKGKAGNENAKVSEVMFINNLNGEGIAEELQRRLEEAEARILAAGQRRRERLAEILGEKKRKSSKKSQQMSALRLQLERKKMERWRKLQTRLEAVQQRRDARLAEIKRRSDEQAALEAIETFSGSGTEQSSPGEKSRPSVSDTKTRASGKTQHNPNSTIVERNTTEEDAKAAKRAKRRASKRKMTAAEIREAEENEFLALCLTSAKAVADDVVTRGSIADIVDSTVEQTNVIWTGPGSIDDTERVGFEVAFKSLQALLSKRTPSLARTAALLDTNPATEANPNEATCTAATLSTNWQLTGASLVQFLRNLTFSAKLSSPLHFTLVALGMLPKDDSATSECDTSDTPAQESKATDDVNATLDAADSSNKRKKKKRGKGLTQNTIIVEADVDSATSLSLTAVALRSIGKEFASLEDDKEESVDRFVSAGGVALLRVYLGAEIGVLANQSDLANRIASPVFMAAVNALVRCCSTSNGCDEVFSAGVAVLVAEISHLLLVHLENWWKHVRAQRASGKKLGVVADNSLSEEAVTNRVLSAVDLKVKGDADVARTDCQTQSHSENTPATTLGTTSRATATTWAEADTQSLPLLLKSLDSLCRHCPVNGQTKERVDAWMWFVFASGLFSATATAFKTLRMLEQHICCDLFFRSLTCRLSSFACGASSFLRLSTGLTPTTIVASVGQLSALKHGHPRGREMTSMIRTSDFVAALISLLDNVVNSFHQPTFGKITMAAHGISASIVRLLVAFASIDVGIVQKIDNTNQVSLSQSIGLLLRSLLAMDDGAKGSVLASTTAFDTMEFSPAHAPAAIGQLLFLVGFSCVRNASLQKIMANTPEVKTAIPLLVFLCRSMPDRYYTQERYKSQLLPTIAAMCADCPEAKAVLEREIDTALITTYFASLSRELEGYKREAAAASSNSPSGSSLPKLSLLEVSARYPTELWG